MAVPTFTKSGSKATTPAKLDKAVFGCKVANHELLQKAYLAYLANDRQNLAITKKRGQVSGGGKKPWRQKGTGRARFGSSRNPIWRGGGIAFGPTGNENYTIKISPVAKKHALRQALSLANDSGKVAIIESYEPKPANTKGSASLLSKIGDAKNVLIVVAKKDEVLSRSVRNLSNVIIVQSSYLNVYDILNADQIIISSDSLGSISDWLTPKNKVSAISKTGASDE